MMIKILIGITGSIAAVKTVSLIHILSQNNYQCKVIITQNGLNFITKTSLLAMGAEVFTDDLDFSMEHINLARWADIILIVPATANIIAKIANGFADNLLTETILASKIRPILVPAMNQQMWKNDITQKNISLLREIGIKFWGPKHGIQACGDNDIGRMLEVDEIYYKLKQLQINKFIDSTILITAGPTIEPIDPVRYISNYSSGKMGYAIAKKAIEYGYKVILISGPTNIIPPDNLLKFISIDTANQMLSAIENNILCVDIFISAAAVSDYKISNYSTQKIKKHEQKYLLELTTNIDIISFIKHKYPNLFVVGFAAETENIINNAIDKLQRKNLDMIVANEVSNNQVFNQENSKVTIINKKLEQFNSGYNSKNNLAKLIIDKIKDNLQ